MREETELTPEQVQRIARFERARGLLGHRPLAEGALISGYADHSHLTREWSRLAGWTPTTWLREELPFGRDHGAASQGMLEP